MTNNPDIARSVPPIGNKSKYGSQPAACTLSKYVVKDVLLGAPNNPTKCMEPDIINIPTIQRMTCVTANLFIFFVITRLDKCGTSQYAIPKKDNATVTPTVKWKCPVINNVLCTTWFNWKFVWAIPPAPPRMNVAIAKNNAKKRASFQGSFLNHPSNPVPPFLRPARSIRSEERRVGKEWRSRTRRGSSTKS